MGNLVKLFELDIPPEAIAYRLARERLQTSLINLIAELRTAKVSPQTAQDVSEAIASCTTTGRKIMNRRSAIALASALLCSGFGLSGAAVAQQTGTAAEASAMLQRAVTELKANQTAAIAKFNKADGGFRDRDLYVYCFEMETGKFTAHANPALMNTDVRGLKEKDGSPLGQKIYNAAKEGTITTIGYDFPKPGGTDPVPKEAYVTRVGDQGCGVGYYK